MFNRFKTRKGRLEHKVKVELENDTPDLGEIMRAIEGYEKDNIDTIDKLKKNKKVEMARINGALKQTINAHGPVTKELIGSAGKRIHGALIVNPNQEQKAKISLRDILIGLVVGSLTTLVILSIL